MARILFTHEPTPDGAILRLMEKRWPFPATPIPVGAWADRMADQAFSSISRILALVDDVESAVEHKEDGLFIDHKTVASLSEPQALGLGFSRERFRASDDVKPSYLIEPGIYLHLDPSLRSAMSVVRQMQRADPESRRRFVQAPQLYLKEALSTVLADDEVERLFVETEQYSARVIDIGVWTPPVIPWIKKEPNDWLPEKFGLKVGNQYVVLTTDDVAPLREMIREAREEGKEFVEFGEEKIRIPSTVEAEQSLSHLLGAIAPSPVPGKRNDLPIGPSEEIPHQKRVLIVEENFDKLGFIRKTAPRKRATQSLPAAIRPSLMKHQQSGLDWMQETWLSGYAGVLLADDMGLGKTLQALGFLAWLREVAAANRSLGGLKGPIIIVAPTGLLANWEKEHDNHLHNPGLGEICRAYGRHLKILKTVSTRDIDRGAPSLDHRRIPPFAKIFPLLFLPKSPAYPSPSRPTEGRLAIVTDAGRDAVDAGSSGART